MGHHGTVLSTIASVVSFLLYSQEKFDKLLVCSKTAEVQLAKALSDQSGRGQWEIFSYLSSNMAAVRSVAEPRIKYECFIACSVSKIGTKCLSTCIFREFADESSASSLASGNQDFLPFLFPLRTVNPPQVVKSFKIYHFLK